MERKFDRDTFRVLLYKTGLTQREFGFKIGVNASSISQYVCGYTAPSKKRLEKIAEALHCEVEDLLIGEKEPVEEVQTESECEEKPKYTEEEKQTLAFESLMTAIELIKIARDMLGEIRKGEKK